MGALVGSDGWIGLDSQSVLVQPDLEESPFRLVSKLWGSFRVNSLYMILLEELRFPLFCSGVGWVVR